MATREDVGVGGDPTDDVPALLALTKAGIPDDIVGLLVRGDAHRGIAAGALRAAILAAAPPPLLVAAQTVLSEMTAEDLAGPGPIITVGASETDTFQRRVHAWMLVCFGEKIAANLAERNHRFLEEALELVQANGCTASEAHQLVDYVFRRPVGEINQEAGGVLVTFAALLNAAGVDMKMAGETELARVWTKVEEIRAKQAAKPKHSPLPA